MSSPVVETVSGKSPRPWLDDMGDLGLPHGVTTERAAETVLHFFVERLTRGEAHALLSALPSCAAAMLRSCEDHRDHVRTGRFDRAGYLLRVAHALGVTPVHAEAIVTAVLGSARRALPAAVVRNVAAQLPHDIERVWLGTATPSEPPPPLLEADARSAVEHEIASRAGLPRGSVGPGAALGAVMAVLMQRLSGGEARHVLMTLPAEIRSLLEGAALDRDERPRVFGRAELLADVAHRLMLPASSVEPIARAVFAAVRRVLPPKEVADVASQLGEDLRELWLSSS